MLKQVEQCCGVHNIAGSNPIAAITLLSVILKQLKIAAGNVKAEQCYGIAPGISRLAWNRRGRSLPRVIEILIMISKP